MGLRPIDSHFQAFLPSRAIPVKAKCLVRSSGSFPVVQMATGRSFGWSHFSLGYLSLLAAGEGLLVSIHLKIIEALLKFMIPVIPAASMIFAAEDFLGRPQC
jgi:hypothetical protein